MLQQTMKTRALVDTEIDGVGPCTVPSTVHYQRFVTDEQRVLCTVDIEEIEERNEAGLPPVTFERAGPRENIYYDPANTKAAIVTAGGLCPGLNDVIRAIVHELYFMYGVRLIKGIRNGFAGLNPTNRLPMIDLTPDVVRHIHEDGGTILGSSRGPQPIDVMVDTLVREDIRILFAIGGDGTLKGAHELYQEITSRGLKISVVGIPKTIDNDISFVSRSFGFDTAVSAAVQSLRCAHVEASGHQNGVGIVKLMGRYSGFIAANAALATGDVNFVLIPEVPFELEGKGGLLQVLEKRIAERRHAVIVVAEGAGQDLCAARDEQDASGNVKLGDIGVLLKQRISLHFASKNIPFTVKYIDPSYIIRSVAANPNDCIFCLFLGQHAAHAAMAGKTGCLVSNWNNKFVHIPIELAVRNRKQVDPHGTLWLSVLEATGQPELMTNGHGS